MKKALAVCLILAFAVSLAACKKGSTSSDSSNTSGVLLPAEQSEADTSAEQTSDAAPESGAESQAAPASSGTAPDKKPTPPKTTAPQGISSQPEQNTPPQDPGSSTQPTQPEKPTKGNPKTDFKFGKYVARFFDNNNQSYHIVSLEFYQEYEGVEYIRDNYYTKEYLKKLYQQRGETFDEQGFYHESEKTLNGITYYAIGDFDLLAEAYEMTDTVIKVSSGSPDKWDEVSLNPDGTLVLERNSDTVNAPVGTVFTRAE